MAISAKARRAPIRLSTGAYIINSGITDFNGNGNRTQQLQATVAQYAPQVNRIDPQLFAKLVAGGEVALGTALLVPKVPAAIAGLGLSAFAGTLLATQLRSPSSAPRTETEAAANRSTRVEPIAKDAWLLGAGVNLLLDALISPAHDKRVEVSATAHEKAAAKKRQWRSARRRAALGDKAQAAGVKLHDAGERLAELREEYQPVAEKQLKKARKKARKNAKHLAERVAG